MELLAFIAKNLDHFRGRFLAIVFISALNGAATFLIPTALAEFTKQPVTAQGAAQLIGGIAGLYVASLGLSWIIRNYGEALAFQFGNYVRIKFFRRLQGLSNEQLRAHHSGYTLSLVNKIADNIDRIVMEILWTFVSGIITFIMFFYFTARESLVLALVNAAIMVVFVGVGAQLAKKMVPLTAEQNKRRATLLSGYADFMANLTTIQKLGIYDFAEHTVNAQTNKLDTQIATVQRFHATRWFILHGLFGLAFIGTIGFLVWSIAVGAASGAILILFIGAYGTIRFLVERLSENIKDYMDMGAYLRQLHEVLGDTAEPTRIKAQDWQTIMFTDVAFRYKNGGHTVRISAFTLNRGDKICITGPSGQGKSTFLNLLTNQLEAQSGQSLVDGKPYKEVGQRVSQSAAIIAQDIDLFNVSVRENLSLGRSISDTTLKKYLQDIGLGEWFNSLDRGLDTIIGEKGATLSAGQKQRLNILRGLLLDRELYILDEPTSHLDDATEALVVKFLAKKLAKKTVVIVTHRPALRKLTNSEYEMRNHQLSLIKTR